MEPFIIGRAASVIILLFLGSSAALKAADKVELVDGSVLKGKVVRESSTSISFRTKGGMEMTLPLARVRAITTASGKKVVSPVRKAAPAQRTTVNGNGSKSKKSAKSGAIPLKDFDRLHALMKPRPGEMKFLDIDWQPNLWAARKKAAAENKPVFIFNAGGDPLGGC